MRTLDVYKVEVGVLVDKDFDGGCYSEVYDRKNGYYDENVVFFFNENKATNYVERYVKDGVPNTYGIVSKLELREDYVYNLDEVIESVNNYGYIEDYVEIFEGDLYDVEHIVYSKCKKIYYESDFIK